MGDGGWFYVPKVWSPAGGWWNNPANGPRNTRIGFVAIGLISAAVFNYSRQIEKRPIKPFKPVPSEMWCTHKPGEY